MNKTRMETIQAYIDLENTLPKQYY